ncbi:MAG: calcium-binding protein, partial [Pseudomonadota bacterium]
MEAITPLANTGNGMMKRIDKYGQQNTAQSALAAKIDQLSDARSTGKDGTAKDANAWPTMAIGDVYYDNFVFEGTSANDTFNGRFGNDLMISSAGADTFYGSRGTDTVDYSGSSGGVTINLSSNPDGFVPHASGGHAAGDKLYSVENIIGSAYADTLYGSSANNMLDGGAGDDTFGLDAGADTLIGGSGFDTLSVAGDNMTINFLTGTGSGGDAAGDTYEGIEAVNFGLFSNGNTFIGSMGSETVKTWNAQTISACHRSLPADIWPCSRSTMTPL